MMYLLDTPVVFELRLARSGGAGPGLIAWATETPRERLFLSALTLVELEAAASRAARDDKAAAAALHGWIDTRVVPAFEGHILPLDPSVARRRREVGIADGRDALFAATALVHGLTLVTRDKAAFKGARVRLFDPAGYEADALGDDADWRSAARGGQWLRNLFIRG